MYDKTIAISEFNSQKLIIESSIIKHKVYDSRKKYFGLTCQNIILQSNANRSLS